MNNSNSNNSNNRLKTVLMKKLEGVDIEEREPYAEFVSKLAKPGIDILASLSAQRCDATHAAMGIAGEAGEILDAIKKWVIYEKPLNVENIIEELGDMEFYLQQLRSCLEIERDEVISKNMSKLKIRYGSKYSDRAAQERADKAV